MKAALFDLDGVLIDTEGTYSEFWAGIGREYGCAPTFALDIKGTTLTDILANHFESDVQRDEVCQKIHWFEHTMTYTLFPGVMEFLKSLRQAGFKTAVVTSSDDTKMAFLARQQPDLLKCFDVVVTGSMVTKSKPDPEGYLTAARLVGADIRDCYVFEDSFQGLEAGMRSGATVIGLATTNSADLLKGKAHEIITGFTGFDVSDMEAVSRP